MLQTALIFDTHVTCLGKTWQNVASCVLYGHVSHLPSISHFSSFLVISRDFSAFSIFSEVLQPKSSKTWASSAEIWWTSLR